MKKDKGKRCIVGGEGAPEERHVYRNKGALLYTNDAVQGRKGEKRRKEGKGEGEGKEKKGERAKERRGEGAICSTQIP